MSRNIGRPIRSLYCYHLSSIGRPPNTSFMTNKAKPISNEPTFNEIEQEVVFLSAVFEITNSMVNHVMLRISGSDPDCEVVFASDEHRRLFNILLVDFLSQTDKKLGILPQSYLEALKAITKKPSFNVDGSVESLRSATRDFVQWLDTEVKVDIWLPNINTQTTLDITRSLFLRMCGNIAKHNFLRLNRVASQLREVLRRQDVKISIEEALLTLEDFYEQMRGIFAYHSTTIAESLNDLRWGIYLYLQPEFKRSFRRIPGDRWRYEFIYPGGLKVEFARQCYWNLMNHVRSEPYMRPFQGTKWFKLRY